MNCSLTYLRSNCGDLGQFKLFECENLKEENLNLKCIRHLYMAVLYRYKGSLISIFN